MSTQTQTRPVGEPTNKPELVRKDNWWSGTLTFFVVFSLFGMWVTFRAFQNNFYYTLNNGLTSHYLSPLYSPTFQAPFKLLGYSISPALWILVFPLAFRLSCYYYRKQIYRAYIADPAGCAVPEPAFLAKLRFRKYTGERTFPLFAQNFHRYAFYAAAIFVIILWKDAFDALWFGPEGNSHLGFGVGTLIMFTNVILLTLYTFSCHSWRHLVGGGLDCYSCSVMNKTRHGLWNKISFLNERHGVWAMASLVSVGLTDVYIYLVCSGMVKDLHS
jgi:hypothetical protein